jgi:hypothetical protein
MTDNGMSFYLIQRCRFKDSRDPAGVDDLFEFDYMGSAEFEFGSLGDSMREIAKRLPEYVFTKAAGLRAKDCKALMIFCLPGHQVEVARFLSKEAKKHQHELKERTGLQDALSGADRPLYRADAWWDIGNHWIAFLGEKNHVRVMQAFTKSRIRIAEKALLKQVKEDAGDQ